MSCRAAAPPPPASAALSKISTSCAGVGAVRNRADHPGGHQAAADDWAHLELGVRSPSRRAARAPSGAPWRRRVVAEVARARLRDGGRALLGRACEVTAERRRRRRALGRDGVAPGESAARVAISAEGRRKCGVGSSSTPITWRGSREKLSKLHRPVVRAAIGRERARARAAPRGLRRLRAAARTPSRRSSTSRARARVRAESALVLPSPTTRSTPPTSHPVAYMNAKAEEEALGALSRLLRRTRRASKSLNEEIASRPCVAQTACRRSSARRRTSSKGKQSVAELGKSSRCARSRARRSRAEQKVDEQMPRHQRRSTTRSATVTTTITALKRLQMLVTAVEQLVVMSRERMYAEAANLLEAVTQLLGHFAEYTHIDKVREAERQGRRRQRHASRTLRAHRSSTTRAPELSAEDGTPQIGDRHRRDAHRRARRRRRRRRRAAQGDDRVVLELAVCAVQAHVRAVWRTAGSSR